MKTVCLDLSPTVRSRKMRFSFAEAKYQVSKAKIFSSLFECEPHHMISVKEIKDFEPFDFVRQTVCVDLVS